MGAFMQGTQLRRELMSQTEPLERIQLGICQRPLWTRPEALIQSQNITSAFYRR